jgi:hypothetical protein
MPTAVWRDNAVGGLRRLQSLHLFERDEIESLSSPGDG